MKVRLIFSLLSVALLAIIGCSQSAYQEVESQFTNEQTSYNKVSDVEYFNLGNTKRVTLRISVPLGRTREELTATLEGAVKKLAKETDASAATVFAYRPNDNPKDTYTAGEATYGPNGQWDTTETGPMKCIVNLADLYFAPPTDTLSVGTTVTLKGTGSGIELSRNFNSWHDEDIIAQVPSGTIALIVEEKTVPLAGTTELTRYRVDVEVHGSTVTGWLHSGDIED